MNTSERIADWETRYDVAFVWQGGRVHVMGWDRLPVEVRDCLSAFRGRVRAWLRDGADQFMPGPLVEEISPGQWRCSIPPQYRGPEVEARILRIVARRLEEELVAERRHFKPTTRFEEAVLGRSRHEGSHSEESGD